MIYNKLLRYAFEAEIVIFNLLLPSSEQIFFFLDKSSMPMPGYEIGAEFLRNSGRNRNSGKLCRNPFFCHFPPEFFGIAGINFSDEIPTKLWCTTT